MKAITLITLLLLPVAGFSQTTLQGDFVPKCYGLIQLNQTHYNTTTGLLCIPNQPLPYIVAGGNLIKQGKRAVPFNVGDLPRQDAIEASDGNLAKNHTMYIGKRWPAFMALKGGALPVPSVYLHTPESSCMDFNGLTGYAIYGEDSVFSLQLNVIFWTDTTGLGLP